MEQAQELTIIDKSIDVFRGGGAILLSHQTRANKALKVGQSILENWEAAYAIADEQQRREALAAVDERSNKYLVNCGASTKEMQDTRKAITQLMDSIKGMYTEEENKIDPKKGEIPAKVQTKRNQFAKEELDYQERKRKEAEARAAKATEASEMRAYIKKTIAQILIDFITKKKGTVTNALNAITLATFEEKNDGLKNMSCVFPVSKLDELIVFNLPVYHRHTKEEVEAIREEEKTQFDFNAFYKEYGRQLTELKQSLIDRLPSKKQELDEQKRIADEAEAAKQAEKLRQEEAERKRQEDMAKSKNEAERKQKEEEAERQRKADADRLAAMEKEAEEKRIAAVADKQRREQEEADRLAAEADAARKKTEDEAELQKAAGTALALFEQSSDSAVSTPAPETRSGYDIKVLSPAGWVEIFTFWFQREGVNTPIDDIGNKKLDQMKKFVEKIANKTGEKIESKNLQYETDVKSVNRKVK